VRVSKTVVRVGIALSSRHDLPDPRLGTRWMIERAATAGRSGLGSLFVGDHHATAEPPPTGESP